MFSVDQLLIRETHPQPAGEVSQKACERDVGGQPHRRVVDEVGALDVQEACVSDEQREDQERHRHQDRS